MAISPSELKTKLETFLKDNGITHTKAQLFDMVNRFRGRTAMAYMIDDKAVHYDHRSATFALGAAVPTVAEEVENDGFTTVVPKVIKSKSGPRDEDELRKILAEATGKAIAAEDEDATSLALEDDDDEDEDEDEDEDTVSETPAPPPEPEPYLTDEELKLKELETIYEELKSGMKRRSFGLYGLK